MKDILGGENIYSQTIVRMNLLNPIIRVFFIVNDKMMLLLHVAVGWDEVAHNTGHRT